MRIVYAIILAIYLVGCDDGKKADVVGGGNGGGGGGLGATGGNGLAPEISKASQLNKARDELIKAVVEERGIPSHPHRWFEDMVNYVPETDDYSPSSLYTIKSALEGINDEFLPADTKLPKAELIRVLGQECDGIIRMAREFVALIISHSKELSRDIVGKARHFQSLDKGDKITPELEKVIFDLVPLIKDAPIQKDHPLAIASKSVLDQMVGFRDARKVAKKACVDDVFPKLEKDPFYEAIDAYREEIKAKDISDADRIKAQEKLIAAIPADRAEPIKGLLEAYTKAKA